MWAVVFSIVISLSLLVAIYFLLATLFMRPEIAGFIFCGLLFLTFGSYVSWLVYDNEKWARQRQ